MCVNRRLEKKAVRIGMTSVAEGTLGAMEALSLGREPGEGYRLWLLDGADRIDVLRRALGTRDCTAALFDRLGLDTKRWVRRLARALDDAAIEDGFTLAEIALLLRVATPPDRDTATRLIPFCKTWLEAVRA